MARLARVIAPGFPHHVTQRGNRRQQTFFHEDDYIAYIDLVAGYCADFEVAIWAYCLMPNHVHLIAVPGSEDGLRRALGEAHRRYTRRINFREGWRGYLWQGRFSSFIMDDKYVLVAARYVEMNPVKAGLVKRAGVYPWSSAAAHLAGKDDRLVKVAPLLEMAGNWAKFLSMPSKDEISMLKHHESTGRPIGNDTFIGKLEKNLSRFLAPRKPGRKRKTNNEK